MDSLKDSLNDNQKTVTLTPQQVQFLGHINHYLQNTLTQLQEHFAGQYLSYLAATEFGLDANKNFHFEYHPEREYDNLVITEKT